MDKYIITRGEIEAYEGLAKTHFLNDNARRINKSLGDLIGLTGFGFHLVEVEPGRESTELHRHCFEDECIYVLDGEAEARIGDAVHQVRGGDFIGYRAGGEAHLLRNTGSTILRYIVVGQRLDHDVVDYPSQGKRLFKNRSLPWNLVDLSQIVQPEAGRKV